MEINAFDLVISDEELEAQGQIFCAAHLDREMTFEQFIVARIGCRRRFACAPHRVRLDRVEPKLDPHRPNIDPSWWRLWR